MIDHKETLKAVVKAVKNVREKQKAYFKSKKIEAPTVQQKLLQDSKDAEKELDRLISQYELDESNEQQQSLFTTNQ